ncbi:1,3-propanediol dehydrogenase [Rhodococcus sp. AW25M09]|nr:1,3-propanediol dehydrogenase [Rhodococcus sp. AW25M09]
MDQAATADVGRALHDLDVQRSRAEAPRVLKFHAPEIVFGQNSLGEAAHAARRLGGVRPMVVTDAGLIDSGWAGQLVDLLVAQGLEPQVWSALTPNPKDFEIEAGNVAYTELGCDVLVAIGGGR